jgi:hypothetical protein
LFGAIRFHALFFRLHKIYFCEGVFKIRESENIFCEGEILQEKNQGGSTLETHISLNLKKIDTR